MSAGLEIVAVGARTPVGLTAESSAAAVRASINRFCEFPFTTVTGEPMIVSADTKLEPLLESRDRISCLAQGALGETLTKLAHAGPLPGRPLLLLALPESRPGFSDQDATWVADTLLSSLRTTGVDAVASLVGRGHAGVVRAIELAKDEVARDDTALFLVLGADSYHHPQTFMWLEHNRQFACPPNIRSGFVPGEGAGCLAVVGGATRRRLRLPCLAVVTGVATAHESLLRDSDTGSFGVGMSEAVRRALTGCSLPEHAPNSVYTDINGERYRSEEWGFAAMRIPSAFPSLEYEAPADCWGDVGAASGALAGILVTQAYARGYARGPRAMVMTGSPSGLRGALLLQDPTLSST